MAITSLFIAIGFSIILLFMFYSSGLIILELFKLKIKNYFISIAIGFFSYFTFLSIFTFPLQLISVLPYIFFIYYIIAISIIYLLFCFIFMRFWLNTSCFKIDSLYYFIIVAIIIVLDYFTQKYFFVDDFSRHKNTLAILYWLKDNTVSFFNDSTLFSFLGFKPFQGWYSFQLATIIIAGIQTYEYKDLIIPFMRILDAFIIGSIFFHFFESFGLKHKTKNQVLIFFISLIIFLLSRMAFWKLRYSIYSGEIILLYLIIFSTSVLLRYTTFNNRERHIPILIGFMLGGYISFSWDSSYQILFLLYAFIFTIQRRFNQNFTKDILKIALFPMLGFIFYNIILKLYVQIIIFGLIMLIMVISSFLMNKNYSFVLKFEVFLKNRTTFAILLVPIFFMTLGVAFYLALKENLISEENNKLNILYIWLSVIRNNIAKQSLTFIASILLLIGSFFWVFFRKNIKSNLITSSLDLFIISYLTFYNPISVRFIRIFYPKMFETNGIALLVLLFTFVNSIPYSITFKNEKNIYDEIVVVKKYSRINF